MLLQNLPGFAIDFVIIHMFLDNGRKPKNAQ